MRKILHEWLAHLCMNQPFCSQISILMCRNSVIIHPKLETDVKNTHSLKYDLGPKCTHGQHHVLNDRLFTVTCLCCTMRQEENRHQVTGHLFLKAEI